MKKLTFVMTLMLAVLMLASCSKKQGSCLIPDNALVVARLDMTKMMESTGMKGDDTSTKKEIEKLIKNAGLPKEAREKLLEIIDDPTSSGIDFTEPFFAYGAATERRGGFEGAFTGCVASKGELEETIEKLGGDDDFSLEEYENGDVKYMMIDRDAAFIFNGDWFYVGYANADIDDTIEELLDRADGKGNIEDNEAFKQMCERKGLMQWAFFGSGIEGIPGSEQIANQLPDGCEWKDLSAIMDFIINKGEIVIETEALLMSDEWKKQADQYGFNAIEKSQAKYADADGALAIINVDPQKLYKYIMTMAKKYGMRGDDLKKLEDLESIFDILSGKGMVAINSWEEDDDPEVVAYLGTRNSDLVEKIVEDKTTDNDIVNLEPNRYLLPLDYDFDYNDSIGDWVMTPSKFMQLGWKDKQTYILINTDDEPFTTPRKSFNDVKGEGVYIYASGKLLGRAVSSADYDMEKAGQAVKDIVDYAEFYMESTTKSVFRIATNKKDKSPIVFIIDYVKRKLM